MSKTKNIYIIVDRKKKQAFGEVFDRKKEAQFIVDQLNLAKSGHKIEKVKVSIERKRHTGRKRGARLAEDWFDKLMTLMSMMNDDDLYELYEYLLMETEEEERFS